MDSAKKEAKEYLKENFPKDKCPCGCMKEVERELREEDEKEAFIADMADQDFVVSNLEGDSADVDEEYEERFLDAEDEKAEKDTKKRVEKTLNRI